MKAIIFDLGNVIAFFDHYRAFHKLRPFSPLTVEEMYASVYACELEDRIERGHFTAPTYLEQVHQLWRLQCDVDFLAHAIGDVFWPNAEVCELIPKLKKRYRLVLGSNTNAVHADRFLPQFADVLGQFDHLVLSYEVGVRKPEAAFYETCVRHANAPAAECVFIDDLPANVEGARGVGLNAILYRPNVGLAGQLHAMGVEI